MKLMKPFSYNMSDIMKQVFTDEQWIDFLRNRNPRFMAALLAEQRDFPRLREWQSSRWSRFSWEGMDPIPFMGLVYLLTFGHFLW